MRSVGLFAILIFSQAISAAALPQPPHGQWLTEWLPCDCHKPSTTTDEIITESIVFGRDPSSLADSAASLADTTQSALSNTSIEDTSTTPVSESVTIIVRPGPSLETVTVTSLSTTQSPTITSALQSSPDTTGTVNPTLETGGHPGSLPFPTTVPTVSTNTLQPLNTTAPFHNATSTTATGSATNTLTIPVSTFETVVIASTVTSVPVPTSVTVTQVTVQNTTFTVDGSTVTSSSVGTTAVTVNATGLTETTVTASSTITGTVSTTVTATGALTGLPSPISRCVFTMGCSGQDVFQPVALTPPPSEIPQRGGHPVPRLGINGTGGPLETNKFYSNVYLGTQGSPMFSVPYVLTWSKGTGNAQSWGMAISHTENGQKVFGPGNADIPGSPASYYINPLGIQSLILSASELDTSTVMTSDSLAQFSVNVILQPNAGSASSITFPLAQGMGFVTALYDGLQPAIQSSIFFRSVTAAGSPKSNVFKYRVVLEDGNTWLIYAVSSNDLTPNFKLVSSTLLQGISGWSGTIQVAKAPSSDSETLYDTSCGSYAVSATVAGYADGTQAEYSISWTKSGAYADNATLLMFALPHHVQSFGSETSGRTTDLTLDTTTKGTATAVVSDYWVMTENDLPTSMGFGPWRPGKADVKAISQAAVSAIQQIAPVEASQNMSAQTNLNSMYYSGKALSKFASIIYVMNDLSDQQSLAAAALVELKSAFATFKNNQQDFPLLYDTDWRGVVSSASYVTGDPGVDFGNSYYNDHHFHYGYFIHAAAVIGYLDPSWLADNQDYVNALVRDVSNPSTLDQYFPVFRAFDWYHGHSWAKGLFESGDGKDQESSSEDTMFSYALKMWGNTIGDKSMEARGNLMLSVQARSLNNYFLLQSDNVNQPTNFIGNKVTGILFENKVDHTTYFGNNLEYIQGIHMLPLQPFSALTRTAEFVTEEWTTYFADGSVDPASNVQGGWRGILYANLALVNPTAAYNFFTQANFDASWLDGGASRTWYIALAAGLSGE